MLHYFLSCEASSVSNNRENYSYEIKYDVMYSDKGLLVCPSCTVHQPHPYTNIVILCKSRTEGYVKDVLHNVV